jgi:hypothetical protein
MFWRKYTHALYYAVFFAYSTMEYCAMDLMVKPELLSDGNRTSTIDALDLDLEDDPIIREEEISDFKTGLPKPTTLNSGNRLT